MTYPDAKPFTPELVVSDRDVLTFDGREYAVRMYPLRDGKLEVRVVPMDNEYHDCEMDCDDDAESINEAVCDCISEICDGERMHAEYLERQRRINPMSGTTYGEADDVGAAWLDFNARR